MLHSWLPIRIRPLRPHLPLLLFPVHYFPRPALPTLEIPQIAFQDDDLFDIIVHKILDLVACLGLPALEIGRSPGGGVRVEGKLGNAWFERFPGAGCGGEGVGCWGVEFELFHFLAGGLIGEAQWGMRQFDEIVGY